MDSKTFSSSFVALGCWVRHLRGRGTWWLVATLAAVALGLFFYVKALLVFPVLAFVALAWFATGGPVRRTVHVVRTYLAATASLAVLAVAYVVYYSGSVDTPFTDTTAGVGKNQRAGAINIGSASGLGGVAAADGYGGWGMGAEPGDKTSRGLKFPPQKPAAKEVEDNV